jgi:hypothetical protein
VCNGVKKAKDVYAHKVYSRLMNYIATTERKFWNTKKNIDMIEPMTLQPTLWTLHYPYYKYTIIVLGRDPMPNSLPPFRT